MNTIRIEQTTSTNNYLRDLLVEAKRKDEILEELTLVITNDQIAGKGQRGTRWEAEREKNLTFSVLVYPFFLTIRQNFLISEVTALAVKACLEEYINDITIKWPNDVYYQDKKICGILIENELQGETISDSIIGVGLNVNQEVFTSDAPNPASLKQITGADFDLEEVLDKFSFHFQRLYDKLKIAETEEIESLYFESLYRNKGFYRYKDADGEFSAYIEKVGSDGYLYLCTETGEERKYAFKEVVFLP